MTKYLVVFIEGLVLSGEGLPSRIIGASVVGIRGSLGFGAFPNVLPAIAEVLSLSSGSVSSSSAAAHCASPLGSALDYGCVVPRRCSVLVLWCGQPKAATALESGSCNVQRAST